MIEEEGGAPGDRGGRRENARARMGRGIKYLRRPLSSVRLAALAAI